MPLFRRIANLFRRARINREIEAELRSHIELRSEENQAAGMPPRLARRNALLRFGNPAVTKEHVTGSDVTLALDSLWFDLRYGLRQLHRNPSFAVAAIGVLALGICASTAIFAFVDAVLIRPLPYRDPTRIMGLFETNPLGPRFHLSYLDYLDWKRLNHTFDSVEVYDGGDAPLLTSSGIEDVGAVEVSSGFFHMLGVAPILGRDFHQGEDRDGAPKVAMLSYTCWQHRYGGRPDVLGKVIHIRSEPTVIVGVLPSDFYFGGIGETEFWTPLQTSDKPETRGEHFLAGVGRLRAGVTAAQAQSDMSNVAALLAKQYPDYDDGRGATVVTWTEVVIGRLRSILVLLMCGAALLLLIASVNVCSLLLVRSENRRREVAVRSALGAPQTRLVRQFIVEGVLLASASAAIGITCAYALMHALVRLIPNGMLSVMPYLRSLGLNTHVLGFAAIIALLAAAQFALTPLARLAGDDVREGLAQGGRAAAGTVWRRLGSNLVVIELCTAMVLLSGAALLGRSFYRLMHTDLGMETSHIAILRMTPTDPAKYDKPYQQVAFVHQLIDSVSHLPGATSASIATHVPLAGVAGNNPTGAASGSTTFTIVGRPPQPSVYEANYRQVSMQFFPTLRARLHAGRFFADTDDAHHPLVMIVNRAFARTFFPGEDPLGHRIGYDNSLPPAEIVGVIDNIIEGSMDQQVGPAMYVPFDQAPDDSFYLVVRTVEDPHSMLAPMAQTVHQIDPGYMIQVSQTLEERVQESQSAYLHRSSAWLVGGFAAMALLLGVVGLYGVIAYSVSQRTREIGVRMALGAQRTSVTAMVMREAGRLILVGVAAGLVCSIGAAILMRNLLYGTAPWDPVTLAAVAAILVLSTATASYLPARRAASVNPVEALRAE